jgi:hypothetical protein
MVSASSQSSAANMGCVPGVFLCDSTINKVDKSTTNSLTKPVDEQLRVMTLACHLGGGAGVDGDD